MSLVSEIAEYYQHHIEIGELAPEDVPGFREIMAEWEVGRTTSQAVRAVLVRAGLTTPQIVHGQPLGPISELDWAFRFLPKVQPRNSDGCLLWDSGTRGQGYGQFELNGRSVQAHRVAWEYRHGPVPEGYELDHVFARGCRSKLCVNHEHLEAVTRAENMIRRHVAARWMAGIQVRTELDSD